MEKSSKKSDVGVVKASTLFVGENRIISNDSNAKIAIYYFLIIDLNSD